MPRLTQHGFPRRSKTIQRERVEIIDPTLGLHAGEVAQDLRPGFTPQSQNFVAGAGFMTPRDGLTSHSHGTTGIGDAPLSAEPFVDAEGNWYAVAASRETIALFNGAAVSWSILSADSLVENLPSASSRVYWDMASIYANNLNQRIVVMTNQGQQEPKYVQLDGNIATYSDFTALYSFVSTARAVTAFDERIIFFNVKADGVNIPNRVAWSVKGNALSDTILLGAGFQDLDEMVGDGLAIERQGNQLVLFSEKEIWVGRKRQDVFAFDFQLVTHGLSTINARTIARTPFGLIFVGTDMEIYAISGVNVQPLGPVDQQGSSRVQAKLQDEVDLEDRMWATYNARKRRYELYYQVTGSSYPTRALYFDITQNAFFEQRFEHELTIGHSFPFHDDLTGSTWDGAIGTWTEQAAKWNTFEGTGTSLANEAIYVYTSQATFMDFESSATNDAGTTIDCRWRSHAMQRRSKIAYDNLDDLWIEYAADSASSASVWFSHDAGATFDDPVGVSFVDSDISVEYVPANVASRAPSFELRLNDGGKPRINYIEAYLRDLGVRHGAF